MGEVKKGVRHKCNSKTFVKNVVENIPQKIKERVCHSVIKSKQEEYGQVIKLSTGGRNRILDLTKNQ